VPADCHRGVDAVGGRKGGNRKERKGPEIPSYLNFSEPGKEGGKKGKEGGRKISPGHSPIGKRREEKRIEKRGIKERKVVCHFLLSRVGRKGEQGGKRRV